jgi:hypothetical protein
MSEYFSAAAESPRAVDNFLDRLYSSRSRFIR